MRRLSVAERRLCVHLVCALCALFFVSILVFTASITAKAAASGDYTYTLAGGQATITGYTGTGGAVTIPSTLDGYSVVAINQSAFAHNSNITSLVVPGSVKTIGAWAFSFCSYSSMTISEGVTSIGTLAFYYSNSLTSINIPSSVTSIGQDAFVAYSLNNISVSPSNANYASIDGILYNKAITSLIVCPDDKAGPSIYVPDTVTSIAPHAFWYCHHLTGITLPRFVTNIGEMAFAHCISLTNLTFRGMIAPTVGEDWVYNTGHSLLGHAYCGAGFPIPGTSFNGMLMGDHIREAYTYTWASGQITVTGYIGAGGAVTIPSVLGECPVVAIGNGAFSFNSNLTSVVIPGCITSIGGFAFSSTSLRSVTISEGVQTIGYAAFYHCGSLTSFDLPSSVSVIETNAFFNDQVTAVNVNASNTHYASISGVLYDKGITKLMFYPRGKVDPSFSLPGTVTTIADSAFWACFNLRSVTLPSGLTTIEEFGFAHCVNLTSIYFQGLAAPTSVGSDWIYHTNASLQGHAFSASNFPPPGGSFNGLAMGEVIAVAHTTSPHQSSSDLPLIIIGVGAIGGAILAAVVVIRTRKM